MKKIFTIFGTRPEAIKMAILCRELDKNSFIDHRIVSTGQHKEMLSQVFEFFEIEPYFDLAIMQAGQDLTDITCGVLKGLRNLFSVEKPDLVLVHGDTTSSMAATLAAFYAGIPVGHVEAGLRTYNLQSPFPEEANRSITGRLADYHFAPTEQNRLNLLNEGIQNRIIVTGNTVIDSLLYAKEKVKSFSCKITNPVIVDLFKTHPKIILVTGHRRENFGDGFIQICEALASLARQFQDIAIVYPVHLNPNVQRPVQDLLSGLSNVYLINPLSYPDFVYAMKMSYIILTDSGGVQEEAPSLGKPVLVMRDTTERPEAVAAGTVKLVGANKEKIYKGVAELLLDKMLYEKMSKMHNPYGDGKAVDRIIRSLTNRENA
jgi:UDP-N-acetylglucosamine 2-epimerase (non-hydrolysing)